MIMTREKNKRGRKEGKEKEEKRQAYTLNKRRGRGRKTAASLPTPAEPAPLQARTRRAPNIADGDTHAHPEWRARMVMATETVPTQGVEGRAGKEAATRGEGKAATG